MKAHIRKEFSFNTIVGISLISLFLSSCGRRSSFSDIDSTPRSYFPRMSLHSENNTTVATDLVVNVIPSNTVQVGTAISLSASYLLSSSLSWSFSGNTPTGVTVSGNLSVGGFLQITSSQATPPFNLLITPSNSSTPSKVVTLQFTGSSTSPAIVSCRINPLNGNYFQVGQESSFSVLDTAGYAQGITNVWTIDWNEQAYTEGYTQFPSNSFNIVFRSFGSKTLFARARRLGSSGETGYCESQLNIYVNPVVYSPPVQQASATVSVPTQAIYRMSDFGLINDNLSTWVSMAYYYTQNPSEAGVYFKAPIEEFRTYTKSPGVACTAQLYKCSYFRTKGDARQFLSPQKNCGGHFYNGSASNPSIGFVCTQQKPGTTRLYEWYRAASEGRVYTTHASDSILTGLGFKRTQTFPEIYVPLE